MNVQIPLRAKNEADFPQLKAVDKKIIAAAVLLQLDNQSAFALYHPEYVDEKGRLNEAGKRDSKFFWNYGKNKDYRQAFEETVEEFLNGKKRTEKSETATIDDSRKDRALKSLLNQAMSLVEGGTELDADTIKVCSDIFTKLGLIKGEEETTIKPLRFLPETCSSCRARIFVESAVVNGDVLDMCQYCKARKVAEEHNYRFDGKTLLDIPKDVMDEMEAKNDVTVADILSGKVIN